MTFTTSQIIILGLIVSLLVQAIKVLSAKFKLTISRPIVSVVVLVIAIVLAWIWNPPAMPQWPTALAGTDPGAYSMAIGTFLLALIQLAAAILGIAFFIYNALLSQLFEKLGWDATTIKANVIAASAPPAAVGVDPASKTTPQG